MIKFEEDYIGWLAEQAELLASGKYEKLDGRNLSHMLYEAHESHQERLRSLYRNICLEFLASGTIEGEAQAEAERMIKRSPSIGPVPVGPYAMGYADAFAIASAEPDHFETPPPRPVPRLFALLFERDDAADRSTPRS